MREIMIELATILLSAVMGFGLALWIMVGMFLHMFGI